MADFRYKLASRDQPRSQRWHLQLASSLDRRLRSQGGTSQGGSKFTVSAWPERARSEAADGGISYLQRPQGAQAVPSASLQPSASTFLSTPARSGTFSCNDPVARNCRICSGTLMSAEQTLLWNSALPCSIRVRLVRTSPQPPRHFVTAAGTPRSRPRPDLTRPPRCLTMSCHLRSPNSRFRSADGCRSTRTDTPATCGCRNGR
jgi:hypothetical protein